MKINVRTLVDLKQNTVSGNLTEKDLDHLSNYSEQVKEKIREYRFTDKTDALKFTLEEAFRTIVYQTKLKAGEPVMMGTEIIPSADLDDTSDSPIIYSRPVLFDQLKILYWKDEPLTRIEFDDGAVEKVNHAPLEMEWDGRQYKLLCEVQKKSFYWPDDVDIPAELTPWLTNIPQDRTTLGTGLKRQGIRLKSFEGIELPIVPRGTTNDLGVWVMSEVQIKAISDELGCNAEASQVTIWFDDGSYFKGTIISTKFSDMSEGIYGGLKRPSKPKENPVTTRGSIMDNYILVPWSASINRQQTDYAGINLPVRAELPPKDLWLKATTGFPGYINQFNDCVTSRAGKLFQKCSVEGYAGKVAVGVSEKAVQFIIRGPKLKDNVVEMAWLFNPSLPVHTDIMKVKVQLIQDDSLDGNLIQLNTHPGNRDWTQYWYMAYAGRDCDGDGFTLSTDPDILKNTKHYSEMEWFDTTAVKSVADSETEDAEMAIRTATERIRLFSSKIGVYDKCARRILRQSPDLMTEDLRNSISEAIQRCISAQKKNSGADKYQGYGWLLKQLPNDADEWLFNNIHDDLDSVGIATKKFLTSELYYRQHDGQYPSDSLGAMLDSISIVKSEMPHHFDGAVELLNLTQYPTPHAYRNMKAMGRQFWAKYQARANHSELTKVLEFITKAKALWSKSSDEEHGLRFSQTVRIIQHMAEDLIAEVEPLLIIGAMLNYLNVNLLGHILTVDNLQKVGLITGMFLHLNHNNVSPGSQIPGHKLKRSVHSGYRPFIADCDYRVEHVHQIGEKTIVKVVEVQ